MIAYAINAAIASRMFDRIIVSTDDAEIAVIAKRHGAEVPFVRPPELADDYTPTVPVITHAIEAISRFGWDVAWCCCIYPGVPLIDPADIVAAWDLLQFSGGRGYAFPVTEFPSAIQRALRRDRTGAVGPFDLAHVATRTQDLEPAYYDAGQFYWGGVDAWLAHLSIHGNGRAIVLPQWRVVDIDTPADWDRAEALYGTLGGR